MYLTRILSGCSLFVLLACPVMASEPLQPRAEVSVKGGSQRSLLTTEFWAPLAQQKDKVLYGDIRLMGDNDENREGNLGIGYRQIKNDAVLGVHGWIDRRRTQHNSTFHQLTLGAERLGHIVDVRSNIYIPLNQGRSIITPNLGVSTPYLAGSGIYYDTNGLLQETPQYGIDWEVGYRLPLFQKKIDALRVYGGGYYFFRDNTVEVPGARFRTEAQVNKAFSVGARVQYDKPRGTQGFLEATLKFPLSAKRLYQESGIRSRLDESPERDVDIVTESNVVDTGLRKPILNTTTGTEQRILYVDNSKPDDGDGSYEKPFNSLKAAEAALQANDILYVNRGDGTTRNMDNGIVIDKPNIQLIGSGSPLTYGRITLLNAGVAPMITNSLPYTTDALSNGVLVTGDNIFITGVSIIGAKSSGIRIDANNSVLNSATITNVLTSTNRVGITISSSNNGQIKDVSLDNIISRDSVLDGIAIRPTTNGIINNINVHRVDVSENNRHGIYTLVSNGAIVNNILIADSNVNNNKSNGAYLETGNTGLINTASILRTFANGNIGSGIGVRNTTVVQDIFVSDTYTNGNTAHGIYIDAVGGIFRKVSIASANSSNNLTSGVYLWSRSSGVYEKVNIQNVISKNNSVTGVTLAADSSIKNVTVTESNFSNNNQLGIYLNTNAGGSINSASISHILANNNLIHGIFINSANATNVTVNDISVFSNDTISNGSNGIMLQKGNSGSTFNIDLGGGASGSIGQNRSFGNTGKDLRLNYTGGGAVFAKNNWWGNVTGLQAGRVTLSASTTVDSTAFLTVDPRP